MSLAAYDVHGTGVPVVFIQGVGLPGEGWRPQVEELSAHCRCLTFDNRGIGRSEHLGIPASVEQMAADTLAVMDHAGFQEAHLAGHSLGGAIAQQIALTARERVLSLSLLCTSARGADAMRFSPQLVWKGMRSRVGSRRMRRLAFLSIVMPEPYLKTVDRDALAATLAPRFGHDLADSPPAAMKQLKALTRFDARPRLAELAGIPTLVMSAKHDIIFPPACGQALAAGVPGAKYIEIADAAHGATMQHAALVNAALLEHFACLPGLNLAKHALAEDVR